MISRHLTGAEFGARFDGLFTRSAFRLELLPRYVAGNEREPFRQFMAGVTPDPAWRQPWMRVVRGHLAKGRTMARVHAVGAGLSDYLRFELTCAYPWNVEAGEDVRIAREPIPWHREPVDFWLFDGRLAGIMSYDDEGNWLGIRLHRIRHVRDCRAWRDTALAASVPLSDYLAEREMTGGLIRE